MKRTRVDALYYGVVLPVGVAGRALWRRRLGLALDRSATTYWRDRGRHKITAKDLRSQR